MNKVIELNSYRKKKDAAKTVKLINRLDFEKIFITKGKECIINLLEKIIRALRD